MVFRCCQYVDNVHFSIHRNAQKHVYNLCTKFLSYSMLLPLKCSTKNTSQKNIFLLWIFISFQSVNLCFYEKKKINTTDTDGKYDLISYNKLHQPPNTYEEAEMKADSETTGHDTMQLSKDGCRIFLSLAWDSHIWSFICSQLTSKCFCMFPVFSTPTLANKTTNNESQSRRPCRCKLESQNYDCYQGNKFLWNFSCVGSLCLLVIPYTI